MSKNDETASPLRLTLRRDTVRTLRVRTAMRVGGGGEGGTCNHGSTCAPSNDPTQSLHGGGGGGGGGSGHVV